MLEILSLLPGLIQTITGVAQTVSGSQEPERKEVPYKTPQEVLDAQKIAENQAYSKMPGYNQAMSNIQQSQEASLNKVMKGATSGSDVLGALMGLNQSSNQAYNTLSSENEAYKTNALNSLKSMLMSKAGYSDKEWQDSLRRYQEEADTLAALKGGGLQNIMGGVGGSIGNYLFYKTMQDYLNPQKKTDALGLINSLNSMSSTGGGVDLSSLLGGGFELPNYNSGAGYADRLKMYYPESLNFLTGNI